MDHNALHRDPFGLRPRQRDIEPPPEHDHHPRPKGRHAGGACHGGKVALEKPEHRDGEVDDVGNIAGGPEGQPALVVGLEPHGNIDRDQEQQRRPSREGGSIERKLFAECIWRGVRYGVALRRGEAEHAAILREIRSGEGTYNKRHSCQQGNARMGQGVAHTCLYCRHDVDFQSAVSRRASVLGIGVFRCGSECGERLFGAPYDRFFVAYEWLQHHWLGTENLDAITSLGV